MMTDTEPGAGAGAGSACGVCEQQLPGGKTRCHYGGVSCYRGAVIGRLAACSPLIGPQLPRLLPAQHAAAGAAGVQGGERGLRRDGLHQETVRGLQIPEVS